MITVEFRTESYIPRRIVKFYCTLLASLTASTHQPLRAGLVPQNHSKKNQRNNSKSTNGSNNEKGTRLEKCKRRKSCQTATSPLQKPSPELCDSLVPLIESGWINRAQSFEWTCGRNGLPRHSCDPLSLVYWRACWEARRLAKSADSLPFRRFVLQSSRVASSSGFGLRTQTVRVCECVCVCLCACVCRGWV